MLKVATAFSGGFGSVELALKYLDIPHEVLFACEWMKPQRESYILNHGEPTSNFYEDIRTLDGTKYKGEIDYYHLSPPCQSYSLAGSRGGAADERGGLMFEAIKSIDQVQPKMFSVENVKGLLSSNNGEDWKNIIRDFKSLKGYTISWGVMNAKEQGTPQNRERVFIVGFRGQAPQFSFPPRKELDVFLYHLLEDYVDDKYFLSEKMMKGFIAHKNRHDGKGNGFGMSPKTRESKIAGAISTKAGNRATDNFIKELVQVGNIDQKGHNSLWGRVYDTNGITPTQNAKGGGAGAKTGLFMVKSNTKCGYETAKLHDGISLSRPTSTTRRGRVGKQVAQTLDTSSSQGVLVSKDIKPSVRENFIRDYDEIVQSDKAVFYSDCTSGFQDNKVCLTESATVRANNNNLFTLDNTMTIRKLTPRECARVQGDFKDMFKFGKASDTKLYEFIGNAMDINTTKNLISRMLDHLKNNVKLSVPGSSSFVKKETVKTNLFDLEIA